MLRFASHLVLVLVLLSLVAGCAPAAGPVQPPAAEAPAEEAPAAEAPAEEAPEAAAGRTFVIASDASFPPMEFVEEETREIVGFDIDLLAAIAADQGFEYEVRNTAWDGIFAGLEGGEYDGVLSSVTMTEERQAQYDFSDPYINAGQAVVVRADEEEIQSHEDLPGKTAGAQIGTTGAFAIEDIEGATLREYDTPDLALLDLVNGNIDAVVVDTPVAADYALNSPQFEGRLKIVGEPFTDEVFGLVVQKGDPSGLLPLFNAGLANLKESGEYDRIYEKWIGGSSESE